MRTSLWLWVCVLSLAVPANAQWREDGVVVPDSAWAKTKDGFGAELYLSNEPDRFLDAWNQPTEGVLLETTETTARGIPVVAFVIFAGCKADDAGLCNASVDFTVLRPDGTEYANYRDKDLWKNKPAMKEGRLQLSADYVGVIIEPGDPLGRYVFEVSVHDLNAGISLDLERSVVVMEPAEWGQTADSSRSALSTYYSRLPSGSFGTFASHAELRDLLVPVGRPMIITILDDLRSTEVPAERKRKALFALGAFLEQGALECEGDVLEVLVSLSQDADDDLAQWSAVLLGEMPGVSFPDAEGWRRWWETEGRARFPSRCLAPGDAQVDEEP